MRLAEYLSSNDISDAAFADRIGVSRQALWRYKTGERRPEWDILTKISTATDGAVSPNDFMPEPASEAERIAS